MKASWNCLQQIINLKNYRPTQLAQQLTSAGLETERIFYDKKIKDIIFNFNLTANRTDISSFVDISKEISTLTDKSLKITQPLFNTHLIENKSFNLYLKQIYISLIDNINILDSYPHIVDYLLAYDIQPNYNILDIITFAKIKWGEEINIYVIDKNYNQNIEIGNEKLQIMYEHTNKKIYLKNRIINTITKHSINKYVHQKSILLVNLITNESYKQNNYSGKYILQAYHNIFQNLNYLSRSQYIYCYKKVTIQPPLIRCSYRKIKQVLGPLTSGTNSQKKYKPKINQKYTKKSSILDYSIKKNFFIAQAPHSRQIDITEEIDIIEEIGRIYGFNQFKDRLPYFKYYNYSNQDLTFHLLLKAKIRSMGFHQVMNYSLGKKYENNSIHLINPLSKEQSVLRTNLIEGLILNKAFNLKNFYYDFEIFEIGKVFIPNRKKKFYYEVFHLAGIIQNESFNRNNWYSLGYPLTWVQAKGHIESLLDQINATVKWSLEAPEDYIVENAKPYIYNKHTGYIVNNNEVIGFLGQLKYQLAKKYNLPYTTYIFEININRLKKISKVIPHLDYTYHTYSLYPKIKRNLSVATAVSLQYLYGLIHNLTRNIKPYIESIELINIYKEKKKKKQD
uniref:phenylalanine--tRNA ligase n=1 Tax=Neogoniolithon spectabile TaxID=231755 RepID=A0A3G3MGN9_9FLOR|nr:phenylalanyl-tRNA synthetase beta chain [Neogoniolithon spectabile]AYR05983.1 phenylalanyl-tRNA synthetase beta chain [Neogoniolithon spectabile]